MKYAATSALFIGIVILWLVVSWLVASRCEQRHCEHGVPMIVSNQCVCMEQPK